MRTHRERERIGNMLSELTDCEGCENGLEGESKTMAKNKESVEINTNNGFTDTIIISCSFFSIFFRSDSIGFVLQKNKSNFKEKKDSVLEFFRQKVWSWSAGLSDVCTDSFLMVRIGPEFRNTALSFFF